MLNRLEKWFNLLICVAVVEFIGSNMNLMRQLWLANITLSESSVLTLVHRSIYTVSIIAFSVFGRYYILQKKSGNSR